MTKSKVDINETTIQYMCNGNWRTLNICYTTPAPRSMTPVKIILAVTWAITITLCAIIVGATDWLFSNNVYRISAVVLLAITLAINSYCAYKVTSIGDDILSVPRNGWAISNKAWAEAMSALNNLIVAGGKKSEPALAASTLAVQSLSRGGDVAGAFKVEAFAREMYSTISDMNSYQHADFDYGVSSANIEDNGGIARLD